MRRQSLVATAILVVMTAAPLAFAQTTTTKKPKKGAPATSATTDTTAAAPATPPPPDPAPTPPPPADEDAPKHAKDLPVTLGIDKNDNTYTEEDPTKTYYFVGARYRGTVIPKFMMNLFVNDGLTFYSNTAAIEFDIRKDHHSTVLWLGYTGLNFGDSLFLQKGKNDEPDNYSIVNSGLGGVFVGLDELWSVPINQAHHWDFEYGFGVGLGVIVGALHNDWAYQTTDGSGIQADNGNHYAICPTTTVPPNGVVNPTNNCNAAGHSNSQAIKVGNYAEPNWFNGGSLPVIFPQISFPTLGLRYKPIKQFEARLGIGFSLTGFWFGLSGDYGLEKTAETATPLQQPASTTTTP